MEWHRIQRLNSNTIMAKFTVWIVPAPSWQCLLEAASGVVYSLQQFGHEARLSTASIVESLSGRLLIFNAHCLPADYVLPKDAIIFNAEQVQITGKLGETWSKSVYLQRLRNYEVWDYSTTNVERLALYKISAKLCPIGFWSGLVDIFPVKTQDIDVLFVGSLNPRRKTALMDMAKSKLVTRVLFGVYGEERNSLIARSKVVLNIHFYSDPIWEIFRVSHLLANKKCVVSEDGGCDRELEALAEATTCYVSYKDLTYACKMLVSDSNKREAMAWRGKEEFLKRNQVDFVRNALLTTKGM